VQAVLILLEQLVASLLVSCINHRLLQDRKNVFQTYQQLGTSIAKVNAVDKLWDFNACKHLSYEFMTLDIVAENSTFFHLEVYVKGTVSPAEGYDLVGVKL
jgi:hypothetical protein